TAALTVSDRCITVGEKDGNPRLTFTVPLINQARCVIFIAAGESKRPALIKGGSEAKSIFNLIITTYLL
ncbi:6-phosphogluconolactonase, partial [Microcystis aeruginosa]|uniref:6-phosphogluconolactonase n=1 Tax=Microcystis aeruginosa TaxID=1126 RepID=UPI002FEE521C